MIKNIFKIIVLPILVLLTVGNLAWGQDDPAIQFAGRIVSVAGSKMSGVVVTVKRDGSVIKSETTASSGKYGPIEVPMGYSYTVSYSKNGYITKTVKIDAETGYFAEEVDVTSKLDLSPSMVEEKPDVDYSPITSKPIMEVTINPQEGGLTINSGYTNQQISKFNNFIKALEEKARQEEKKFNDLVKSADSKAASGDYAGAVADYNAALGIKTDPGVTGKVTDAKTRMKAKADFDKLIADGDQLVASGNFDGGIAKFEEAKQLFPTEKTVNVKIKDANEKKTAAAAAELKKEFAAKMAEAKAAFEDKDYAFAQKKYEDASVLIPSEQEPKTKINEIKKLIQEQIALDQKYATLITEGDKAMLEKSYDLAIEKFNAALEIKKESHPETQLAEAKKLKQQAEEEAKAAKAAQEKFSQLIKDGLVALSNEDLDDAESKFKEALALDVDNPKAEIELAKVIAAREALEAKKAAEEAAAKKAEFETMIKSGDAKLATDDFENSIAEYQKALEMGIDDVRANAKLDAAKTAKKTAEDAAALAAEEAAKVEAFNSLMSEGQTSYDTEDYDAAIVKFQEALAMGVDNSRAQDGLNLANDALAQLKRDKEKAEAEALQEKFEQLIKDGDSEFNSNEFDAAIAKYTSAKELDLDNALADQKITEANNAKLAAEKAATEAAALEEQKIAFEKQIEEGNVELDNENFDAAISKYTSALNLDYNNSLAQGKIDATLTAKKAAEEAKIAEEEAKKKSQFDELISLGDEKLSSQDFDGAISQFQNALDLDYDNTTAQAKMDAAKATKQKYEADLAGAEKAELEAAKKADFEALINTGDTKLTSEDFGGAISDYTSALNLDFDNPSAQAKIENAQAAQAAYDKRIAEEQSDAAAAANKIKYDAFITAGDAGLAAESFEVAIGEYESALATGFNDTEAQSKLAIVKAAKAKFEEALESANAKEAIAVKKAEFERMTTEGSLKLGDNDFEGAIASFTGALDLDYNNPKAQEMINSAKIAKEEYEKSQEVEETDNTLVEFNELIAKGDAARDNKDYDAAINLYSEASSKMPTSLVSKERIDAMKALKASQAMEEESAALFAKLMETVQDLTQKKEYLNAKKELKDNKPLFPLKSAEIDQGIVKLDQLIADREKEAEKEVEYKSLIDRANVAFEKADWDASEKDYIKALSVFDREYPKEQLKLIAESKASDVVTNAINEEDEQLRKEYETEMANGASNFDNKKYEDALINFKTAKKLFPEESKPQAKIDEINKIIKDLADSSSDDLVYTNALANADAKRDDALSSGADLTNIEALKVAVAQGGEAKDLYAAANTLNSEDTYPQEQVTSLNTNIANWSQIITETESYNKIIAKADELLDGENLDGAEKLYTRAQGFKAEDPYPPAQLEKIKRLRNKVDVVDDYNELIEEGDKYFNNDELDPALDKFTEAKEIKPEAKYPKEKINQIRDIKAERAELDRLKSEQEREEFAANSVPDMESIDPMDLNEIRQFFRDQQEDSFSDKDDKIQDYKNKYDDILADDVDSERDKSDAANERYDDFEQKRSDDNIGLDDRRLEKLEDIDDIKGTEMDKRTDLVTSQTSKTNVTNDTYTEFENTRSAIEDEQDLRRTSSLDDFDTYKGTQREVSDKYNSGEQKRTEAVKLYNTKAERKSEQLTNYLDEDRQQDVPLIQAYKQELSELGESRIERSTDDTYATLQAKEKMINRFEEEVKDQDKIRSDKTVPSIELYKKSRSEELGQLTDQGTDATYETKDQYSKMEKDISESTSTWDDSRKDVIVEIDAFQLSEYERQSNEYNAGIDRTQSTTKANDDLKTTISEKFVESDKTREESVEEYNSYTDDQSNANANKYKDHIAEGVDKANEINGVKSQKSTMFSDTYVDPLATKYGEGIHEETFQRTSASGKVLEITVQRIVVRGNKADTYKMVSNQWSTNYFKNGAIIPSTTWDTDTH